MESLVHVVARSATARPSHSPLPAPSVKCSLTKVCLGRDSRAAAERDPPRVRLRPVAPVRVAGLPARAPRAVLPAAGKGPGRAALRALRSWAPEECLGGRG